METKKSKSIVIELLAIISVLGSITLIITLFTQTRPGKFGVAVRMGVPFIPESLAKCIFAMLLLIVAYGLIKFKKWGFWLFVGCSIYSLVVSCVMYARTNDVLFSGNIFSSLLFLIVIWWKRDYYISGQNK